MKKGLKLKNYKHLKFSIKNALLSNLFSLTNPRFYFLQQLTNSTEVLVNKHKFLPKAYMRLNRKYDLFVSST